MFEERTLITSGDLRRMAVLDLIVEYIESGDVTEALADLNAKKSIQGYPSCLHDLAHCDISLGADFVEAAVVFGVEHHAYERELISQLLSSAHSIFEGILRNDEGNSGFSSLYFLGKGYDEGFQRILYNLPDLVLDVPNAAEYVGLVSNLLLVTCVWLSGS